MSGPVPSTIYVLSHLILQTTGGTQIPACTFTIMACCLPGGSTGQNYTQHAAGAQERVRCGPGAIREGGTGMMDRPREELTGQAWQAEYLDRGSQSRSKPGASRESCLVRWASSHRPCGPDAIRGAHTVRPSLGKGTRSCRNSREAASPTLPGECVAHMFPESNSTGEGRENRLTGARGESSLGRTPQRDSPSGLAWLSALGWVVKRFH